MRNKVITSSTRCILRIGGYGDNFYMEVFGRWSSLSSIAALAKNEGLFLSYDNCGSIDRATFSRRALPAFRFLILRKSNGKKQIPMCCHIIFPIDLTTSAINNVDSYNKFVEFFKVLFKFSDCYGTRYSIVHEETGELFEPFFLNYSLSVLRSVGSSEVALQLCQEL